jgi:hypothetical protein
MKNYHEDEKLEIPDEWKLGITIVVLFVLLLNL